MTFHNISVLFEQPYDLLYKLWWYNNIDLTRTLKKNRHFLRFYPFIYEKQELTTNRHCARSVTFEAVIFEVLLYYQSQDVSFSIARIDFCINHFAYYSKVVPIQQPNAQFFSILYPKKLIHFICLNLILFYQFRTKTVLTLMIKFAAPSQHSLIAQLA